MIFDRYELNDNELNTVSGGRNPDLSERGLAWCNYNSLPEESGNYKLNSLVELIPIP